MRDQRVFVQEDTISGTWLRPWTEADMALTGRELYERYCEPAIVTEESGADCTFNKYGWRVTYPDGAYSVGAVMKLRCIFEELVKYCDTLEELLKFPNNPQDIPEWESVMRELWISRFGEE